MTPEEYQQLIDAGWTEQEIRDNFGVEPPAGYRKGAMPGGPSGPSTTLPSQKPYGVSDQTWNQYLAYQKDYDEAWNDLKAAQDSPSELSNSGVLRTRANNAASLLSKAKSAIASELATNVRAQNVAASAVDPTDRMYKEWDPGTGQYVWRKNENFDEGAYNRRQSLLDAQIAAQNRAGLPHAMPYRPGEEEYQRLQNEALRQKLKTDYQLAIENHSKTIDAIQAQMAAGTLDYKQAQKMVDLSRANMEAALKGTTPFAMDQARRQEESQKRTLAANLLQDRMSIGSNLAQGLLSGVGSIYGKILSSSNPPLNFNPMTMAQEYMSQMGGGQDMAETAKALLMGALQKSQQQEPQRQWQGEVM